MVSTEATCLPWFPPLKCPLPLKIPTKETKLPVHEHLGDRFRPNPSIELGHWNPVSSMLPPVKFINSNANMGHLRTICVITTGFRIDESCMEQGCDTMAEIYLILALWCCLHILNLQVSFYNLILNFCIFKSLSINF